MTELTRCERNWCLVVLAIIISSSVFFCLGLYFIIAGIISDVPFCIVVIEEETNSITFCLQDEEQTPTQSLILGIVLSSSSLYCLIWVIRRL